MVRATGATQACSVVGIPGYRISNVTLDDVQITCVGGGTPEQTNVTHIQLKKLSQLNARRKTYVEALEAEIESIPCIKPVKVYPPAERGGYNAFPVTEETFKRLIFLPMLSDHLPGTVDRIIGMLGQGIRRP